MIPILPSAFLDIEQLVHIGISPGFTPIASQRFDPDHQSFIGPINVQYLDGKSWKLTTEYVYCSHLLQTCIRAEAGFVTDFASIPRVLWPVLAPTDERVAPAAIVHDRLYRDPAFKVTKDEADHVLIEGMELLGASVRLRSTVYWALRMFGRGFKERAGG